MFLFKEGQFNPIMEKNEMGAHYVSSSISCGKDNANPNDRGTQLSTSYTDPFSCMGAGKPWSTPSPHWPWAAELLGIPPLHAGGGEEELKASRGGELTGSLRAHSQSLFLAQASSHSRLHLNCPMLPLLPPLCGGSKILTPSSPLHIPPTLAFLPDGLCAISAAQSSLFQACIFPSTVQRLSPTQASFWKLIPGLRASTHFLCAVFAAWGSSDLTGKLTWHSSLSLTHCGLWVPTASGTDWSLGDGGRRWGPSS